MGGLRWDQMRWEDIRGDKIEGMRGWGYEDTL